MRSFLVHPWRSVWLPRVVTAVALVIGLPLYLRMPLWCDLTLYDLAARNLLRGGMHYRDVFDTNLPGFVWLLTAIRWMFGFGAFTLRCVDLAIVIGIVVLVDRFAKSGGATLAARWWVIAGIALIYPFTVEMVHCQRDVWMSLPVLLAVWLRVRRVAEPSSRPFLAALLEGVLWGMAVWIKPHVVLLAATVWLFTARRVAEGTARPWRGCGIDLLGNVVGGLLIGTAGVTFLVASGTWPYFWEIITVWGPEYTELSARERDWRTRQALHWFPPWSLGLVLAFPLAILAAIDALPWARQRPTDDPRLGPIGWLLPGWLWDREASPHARFVRGTIAALYIVWTWQSYYIQRGFSYVHIVELFLMLALFAMYRWAVPFLALLWLIGCSATWMIANHSPALQEQLVAFEEHDDGFCGDDPGSEHYVVRHPITDFDRLQHWPTCWRFNLSDRERYQLWDEIKFIKKHEASPGWVELAEVADYLRHLPPEYGPPLRDHELLAWHDSPHVLYLILDMEPGIRFMHLQTIQAISPRAREQLQMELTAREGVARFAISDLGWATLGAKWEQGAGSLAPPNPHAIGWGQFYPPGLPGWTLRTFPFNQQPIYRTRNRTGRYIIHWLQPPFESFSKKQEQDEE